MIKSKGIKCIKTFKKGEKVVGITTFKDKVIVATEKGIYFFTKDSK